jgi:hypothetical protein
VALDTGSCGCVASFAGHNRHAPRYGANTQTDEVQHARTTISEQETDHRAREAGGHGEQIARRQGVTRGVVWAVLREQKGKGDK